MLGVPLSVRRVAVPESWVPGVEVRAKARGVDICRGGLRPLLGIMSNTGELVADSTTDSLVIAASQGAHGGRVVRAGLEQTASRGNRIDDEIEALRGARRTALESTSGASAVPEDRRGERERCRCRM